MEHQEELLNLTIASSAEEAGSEDFEEDSSMSLKVVKKLHRGKVLGMDEIRPEMLKALGIVGSSWLHASSLSCEGQGQCLWSGRLEWWFLSSRKGTTGYLSLNKMKMNYRPMCV